MFMKFIGRVLKLIKTLENLTLSVFSLLLLHCLFPLLVLIILSFLYLSPLYILNLTHIIINPKNKPHSKRLEMYYPVWLLQ